MTLFRVGPSGGIGGHFFDDGVDALPAGIVDKSFVNVVDIFTTGQFVNSIQFFNIDISNQAIIALPKHGVDNGTRNRIVLAPNEFIVAIVGNAGRYVDRIGIQTTLYTHGPFGGSGGKPFVYAAPFPPQSRAPDIVIVGVHGNAGAIIDSLGVILQRPRVGGLPG
jgi:jacalin-like lectin domain-containing protein